MSNNTMPMLSPDGQVGDVPLEQVPNAVKGGYKVGQDMLSPDGKSIGTVPLDAVHDAIGKGFQLKGSAPKLPQPDMQTAGVVVPDAGRIPGVQSQRHQVTDKQAAGGLAAGAVAGAVPFSAAEIPTAMKAVQEMAEAHPLGAKMIKRAMYLYGSGLAMKHGKWLLDLLP